MNSGLFFILIEETIGLHHSQPRRRRCSSDAESIRIHAWLCGTFESMPGCVLFLFSYYSHVFMHFHHFHSSPYTTTRANARWSDAESMPYEFSCSSLALPGLVQWFRSAPVLAISFLKDKKTNAKNGAAGKRHKASVRRGQARGGKRGSQRGRGQVGVAPWRRTSPVQLRV